jgi:hypothetical protein
MIWRLISFRRHLVTTLDDMTPKELNDLMELTIFPELRRLRGAGQAEYARALENAFANFDRVAEDLEIPREKVLWTYAMKHKDGIASWINGHRSQREDVRGRIADLILYMVLLWGMVEESSEPKWVGPTPEIGDLGQRLRDSLGTKGLIGRTYAVDL